MFDLSKSYLVILLYPHEPLLYLHYGAKEYCFACQMYASSFLKNFTSQWQHLFSPNPFRSYNDVLLLLLSGLHITVICLRLLKYRAASFLDFELQAHTPIYINHWLHE